MIDWHSHILPGIDDGAAGMEQSLAMASALSVAGFSTVYCTPHLMRGCYEAGNDAVLAGVAELQERLNNNDIPLTLLPGREYVLDEYLLEALQEPLTLGISRLVLIEIPSNQTADMVRQVLYQVVCSGFTPIIAHPERCKLLEPVVRRTDNRSILDTLKSLLTGSRNRKRADNQSDGTGNSLLDYLRDLGCGFQGNLGSFSGFYGSHVKAVANTLRNMGIYDRYGSDLHAPKQAGIVLKTAGIHRPQKQSL